MTLPPHRLTLAAWLGAAIGLAAPLSSTAQAQEAPQAAERGAHRGRHGDRMGERRGHMQEMARELGLTDAQREQMRALRQGAQSRGRALRESGDRAALGAHREAMRQRMAAILTPEQRARAQELRTEHAQRRTARHIEQMTERLELSPRQVQQVTGVLRHAQSQRRALHAASQLDGTNPREAMEALQTRTRDQIRAILTEAQQARMQEMRGHFRGRDRRAH